MTVESSPTAMPFRGTQKHKRVRLTLVVLDVM